MNYQYLDNLVRNFSTDKRYEREFEQIKKIGRGGFSSVYMARNRLDDNLYAIKKIILKPADYNSKGRGFEEELLQVLREIRCLARLKQSNIVGYNQSWVEISYVRDNSPTNSEEESACEVDFSFECSDIEFEEEPSGIEDNSTNDEDCPDLHKQNLKFEKTAEKKIDSVTIYIQMELCKETLDEHMKKHKFSSESDRLDKIRKIMYEVLSGLKHIHMQANLIHRDLKPKNIFFSQEEVSKIGDFGLCKNLENACTVTPSPSIKPHSMDPIRRMSCRTSSFKLDEDFSHKEEKTQFVGTPIYASPEQLTRKDYDQKSDIWSLGLIMLELYCPTSTQMERIHMLENARKATKLPELLKLKAPKEYELIRKMLSHDPVLRPNIEQLIIEFSEIVGVDATGLKLRRDSEDIELIEAINANFKEGSMLVKMEKKRKWNERYLK